MLFSAFMFSCDKNDNDTEQSQSTTEETTTDETTTEDEEQSGTPGGTIAERALLALLEKENITLTVDFSADGLHLGQSTSAVASAKAYIKKKDGKYKLQFDISGKSAPKLDIDGVGVSDDGEFSLSIAIADGKISIHDTLNGKSELVYTDTLGFELDVEGGIDKLIALYGEDIKNILGVQISSSADIAKLLNNAITVLTFNGKVGTTEDGGYSFVLDSEHAPYINSLAAVLVKCENESIGELISQIAELAKLNMDEKSFIMLLEKSLTQGLEIKDLILNIENAYKDMTGKELSIKSIIDAVQQNSGYSTEQIVEVLKANITSPKIKSQLNAPKEGETIYDYLLRKFGALVLDSLVKGATGQSTVDEAKNAIIAVIKDMTLKDAIASVIKDTAKADAIFDSLSAYSARELSEHIKIELDKNFNLKLIEIGVGAVLDRNGAESEKAISSVSISFDYN